MKLDFSVIPSLAGAAVITGAGFAMEQPVLGASMGVTTVAIQMSCVAREKETAQKLENFITKLQQQQATQQEKLALRVETEFTQLYQEQQETKEYFQEGFDNLNNSIVNQGKALQDCQEKVIKNTQKNAHQSTSNRILLAEVGKLRHQVKVNTLKLEAQAKAVKPTQVGAVKTHQNVTPIKVIPQSNLQVDKVLCLIDSNNFKFAREKMDGDVDYQSLKNLVAQFGSRLVMRYVTGEKETSKNFVKMLESVGYEVQCLPVVPKDKNNWKTLGDDIAIAQAMCEETQAGDTVVLISGDGDYVPTIQQIQKKGVKVIVMAHSDDLSTQLKNTCDQFIDLKDIWLQIVKYGCVVRRIKAA